MLGFFQTEGRCTGSYSLFGGIPVKILIWGSDYSGIAAACALSKAGHNVSIADPAAFPGADILDARHSYILSNDGMRIDIPLAAERKRLFLLMSDANVRFLPCLRLAGVFADANKIHGLLFASKYGLFREDADLVLDASSGAAIASQLTGHFPKALTAEYGFDTEGTVLLPDSIGFLDNSPVNDLRIGWTVREATANVTFTFPCTGLSRTESERKAHELSADVCRYLRSFACSSESVIFRLGAKCRFFYSGLPIDDRAVSIGNSLKRDFTVSELQAAEASSAAKALNAVSSCRVNKADKPELFCRGMILPYSTSQSSDPVGMMRVSLGSMHVRLPVITANTVIAGAGCGGAMAGWALSRKKCDYLIADTMYFCGGTNTVGTVYGNWHGYNGGAFALRYEEADKMPDKVLFSKRILGMMYWEREFSSRFLGGVTFCSASLNSRHISELLACDEYGLVRLKGRNYIDGTADADLLHFCGLPTAFGGTRDGVPQTSSVWGISPPTVPFGGSYSSTDEDVIDVDSYEDYRRGLSLSYLHKNSYDAVPLCMQRESRRFEGRFSLTMAGIARREIHDDDIAVALCIHDTHGRCSSLMNQFGLFSHRMLEPEAKDIRIRLPFRMFLPEQIDNIAVAGKSMSGEREAVALCRMNPEICNIGFALGTAAAYAGQRDISALAFDDIKKLRNELCSIEVLPSWADNPGDFLDVTESLDDPSDGGFSCMVQPKDRILPLLLHALEQGGVRAENAAMALAWHGFKDGVPLLLSVLERESACDAVSFRVSGREIIAKRSDGFEKVVNPHKVYGYTDIAMDDPDLSYSRINRLIVLLGLAGADIPHPERFLLCVGGNAVFTGKTPYGRGRIDGHRLPEDDRVWAMLTWTERTAAPDRLAYIEQIYDRLHFSDISPETTGVHKIIPPRIVQQKLALLRAAAHCGSTDAAKEISRFLQDERRVFRGMAEKALSEVYGKNMTAFSAFSAPPVTAYRGDPFLG